MDKYVCIGPNALFAAVVQLVAGFTRAQAGCEEAMPRGRAAAVRG
jgi:hypothetical protein